MPDPQLESERIEEVTQALRAVMERVRTTRAPAEVLDRAARTLRALAADLEPHSHPGPYQQTQLDASEERAWEGLATLDPQAFFPYSPVIGPRNPLAAPARFEVSNGEIHGEVTLGPVFNGPPGSVHGGVTALVFDEVLGCTALANGFGGYTGTLSVRYLKPVPIGEPLRLEGRMGEIDGRKAVARGQMWVGDVLCAEAEGVFVQPRQPMG